MRGLLLLIVVTGCVPTEGDLETATSDWAPSSWANATVLDSPIAAPSALKAEPEPVIPEPVVIQAAELDGPPPLVPPEIAEWMPELRRCHRRPRRYCDGPRRVPLAHGEGAARAELFSLGTRRTYDVVLSGPADEALLAEAGTPEETLLWPVPEGTMGRGFGYVRRNRLRGKLHRGVDIPAAVGALVRGANDGLVICADNEIRGYGNLVVVLHGDDSRTFYAHLDRAYVFAGQRIERGQVIGEVGRTGLTRAPHLHFEYRRRAVPRNPRRLFVERPTGDEERRLLREQLERRRAGEAQLAEYRERAERRRARREAREASEASGG